MAMRAQHAAGTAYRKLGLYDVLTGPGQKARQDTAVMWTRLVSSGLWRVAAGSWSWVEPTAVIIRDSTAMAMRAQHAAGTAYRKLGLYDVPKGPA